MTAVIQRSLAQGEISPALRRQVNLTRYSSSVKTMRNFFVRKNGGASNRAGTNYVYGAADPDQNPAPNFLRNPISAGTKMLPWEAPTLGVSYIIEVGQGFLRFFKNGALVTVDAVADWNAGTSYVVGDLANFQGVNYYCVFPHMNHQPPSPDYWFAQSGYEYSIPSPWGQNGTTDPFQCYPSQDASYLLITHPRFLPHILLRNGSDTSWVLYEWISDIVNGTLSYGLPRIGSPNNLLVSGGMASGNSTWAVTAVTTDGEESLPAFVTGTGGNAAGTATLTWDVAKFKPQNQARPASTGTIRGYTIYELVQGKYFFLAFSTTNSWGDVGVAPSPTGSSPPEARAELNDTADDNFPSVCGVFEGRTLIGNFPFNVQAWYGSRIGQQENFTGTFPAAANDSILSQVRGKRPSDIRHFIDLGALVILTGAGEFLVQGDSLTGNLTPSACFPRQYGYRVAKKGIWPIIIGSRALYVQEQGAIIRAISFSPYTGMASRAGFLDEDLCAFADHLFLNHEIVAMSYQKTPHSIVWCVRDDGALLSLTYIPEQQIQAWARHDTLGAVEDVCCVQEGTNHAVYILVRRTIHGQVVRYIERMVEREFSDVQDCVFTDCSLTYDGRNSNQALTMTLTGGVNWDQEETLLISSSMPYFSAVEIGNEIWLTGTDGKLYRGTITGWNYNDQQASFRPYQQIPAGVGIRGAAIATWSRATASIKGLEHLEGQNVSIFADGVVVASPNNKSYPIITITGGGATMPQCQAYVHVGLPFISDIETLDLDTQSGETLVDKNKNVQALGIDYDQSRGVWTGPQPPDDDSVDPLQRLTEVKMRENESFGQPVSLFSDYKETAIESHWNSNGRAFVRQVDPLPVTIVALTPAGYIPFRGGS